MKFIVVVLLSILTICSCGNKKTMSHINPSLKQILKLDFLKKSNRELTNNSQLIIRTKTIINEEYSFGVGTALHKEKNGCYFMTASHLFNNSLKDTLFMSNWSFSKTVMDKNSIDVIYTNKNLDLAVIYIKSDDLECEPAILFQEKVLPLTAIYGYGNPVDGTGVVSSGIVSSFWDDKTYGEIGVADINSTFGFSGGGVFNKNNNFVGMIIGQSSNINSTNFTYFITSDHLLPILTNEITKHIIANIRLKDWHLCK